MILVPNIWMAHRPYRGERQYMNAYMVIKVMRDGTHKAEFLNDRQELEVYLLGLRSIDREYMVFVWSGDAYQLTRRFQP